MTNIAEISQKKAQAAEKKELLRCQRLTRHMDQDEQRMIAYINTELGRGREPEDERLLKNRRAEILRGIERKVNRDGR